MLWNNLFGCVEFVESQKNLFSFTGDFFFSPPFSRKIIFMYWWPISPFYETQWGCLCHFTPQYQKIKLLSLNWDKCVRKGKFDKNMMDWMTCDFIAFLTVFQLYSVDGKVIMIMKDYVQWNLIYGWKDFRINQGFFFFLNLGPLDYQKQF